MPQLWLAINSNTIRQMEHEADYEEGDKLLHLEASEDLQVVTTRIVDTREY